MEQGVRLLDPMATQRGRPGAQAAVWTAAQRVLASGQYILGGEVAKLERQLAPLLGCRYAVGVSNGSDALLLALAAAGVAAADEVLLPSYTFVASGGSVARLGARPRFVDVCPSCLTLLPGHAEGRLTAHTKAILPVHLFGQNAHLPAVWQLARRHNLAVVEDAAQSFAAAPDPAPQGELPHLVATSFFPSKNLGGFGDAGAVACNDAALDAALRALRVHGSHGRYQHERISGNFRMDALQAALLATQLGHLPAALAARRQNAARYRALFAAQGCLLAAPQESLLPCLCAAPALAAAQTRAILTNLDRLPADKLLLPEVARRHGPAAHTFNQYVVRFARPAVRDHVARALAAGEVGHAIYYPTPLHLQPCFAYLATPPGTLPFAEQAARTTLALPIAEHLTPAAQEQVVVAVARALRTAPAAD